VLLTSLLVLALDKWTGHIVNLLFLSQRLVAPRSVYDLHLTVPLPFRKTEVQQRCSSGHIFDLVPKSKLTCAYFDPRRMAQGNENAAVTRGVTPPINIFGLSICLPQPNDSAKPRAQILLTLSQFRPVNDFRTSDRDGFVV